MFRLILRFSKILHLRLTNFKTGDKIPTSIEARVINSNSVITVCRRPHCERGIRRRGGLAAHALVDGNNISATVAENAECYQQFDGYFIGSRLFLLSRRQK